LARGTSTLQGCAAQAIVIKTTTCPCLFRAPVVQGAPQSALEQLPGCRRRLPSSPPLRHHIVRPAASNVPANPACPCPPSGGAGAVAGSQYQPINPATVRAVNFPVTPTTLAPHCQRPGFSMATQCPQFLGLAPSCLAHCVRVGREQVRLVLFGLELRSDFKEQHQSAASGATPARG